MKRFNLMLLLFLFGFGGQAHALSLHGTADLYFPGFNMPIMSVPITGGYDATANTLQIDPFSIFGSQLQTNVTQLLGPGTYNSFLNGIPTTTTVAANQIGAYMTFSWSGYPSVQTVMVWNVVHDASGEETFTAVDTDGDGIPGQAFNAGPYPGLTLAYDLDTGPVAPGVDVSVSVSGGSPQQCSAIGGSTVDMTADVHLLRGAQLSSVQWYIDGASAGTGMRITPFLKLGRHDIKVVATITTGTTATASTSVSVVDTIPPKVTAGFVDVRTGDPITSISGASAQFVGISVHATDVCDASPTTSAAVVPSHAVKDGDTILIQGQTGQVELSTSALSLGVIATDASGNRASAHAVLNIQP